jgi:hypothetical protein
MLEVRAAVKDGRELIVCDIGVEKGEASQLEHRCDSERFPSQQVRTTPCAA